MPYEIKLHPTHEMLEIRFYGDISYDEALSARQEASSLAESRKVKALLVDQSKIAPFHGTTSDMFDFHTSHEEMFPPDLHMALVYSPETTKPADARFAESVALNHGLLFGAFTRRREALDWLIQERA